MSSLHELQNALDLYGAAQYWYIRICGRDEAHSDESAELRIRLRQQALDVGATAEQLDDAVRYAARCLADHRRPLRAEVSFAEFCRRNGF